MAAKKNCWQNSPKIVFCPFGRKANQKQIQYYCSVNRSKRPIISYPFRRTDCSKFYSCFAAKSSPKRFLDFCQCCARPISEPIWPFWLTLPLPTITYTDHNESGTRRSRNVPMSKRNIDKIPSKIF